jgi:Sulfotransferase family
VRRSRRDAEPADLSPGQFRTKPDDRFKLTDEGQALLKELDRRSADTGRLSPLSYNLTVGHQHRFIWFRVAKVATRTIRHHFTTHAVPLDVDHAMRIRYPVELFDDYFKFAFVRDPLDRFVSAWHNKVVDMNYFHFDEATLAKMQDVETFARWAADQDLGRVPGTDQHLALQTRLIDLSQVDFVGRLETFDQDFAEVCQRIGAPAVPTVAQNQTASRGSTREVSDTLRGLVETMYRRDYQILGY